MWGIKSHKTKKRGLIASLLAIKYFSRSVFLYVSLSISSLDLFFIVLSINSCYFFINSIPAFDTV